MIHIIQTLIFTAYILLYWKHGTKSISMTTEVYKYSYLGFYFFMLAISIPFIAGETGQLFYGVGSYQIAGFFLIASGTSYKHQMPVMKQVHHAVSFFAIAFGFYALGLWTAVIVFASLCLISYIVLPKYRFLWFLECAAFYTIIFFRI